VAGNLREGEFVPTEPRKQRPAESYCGKLASADGKIKGVEILKKGEPKTIWGDLINTKKEQGRTYFLRKTREQTEPIGGGENKVPEGKKGKEKEVNTIK